MPQAFHPVLRQILDNVNAKNARLRRPLNGDWVEVIHPHTDNTLGLNTRATLKAREGNNEYYSDSVEILYTRLSLSRLFDGLPVVVPVSPGDRSGDVAVRLGQYYHYPLTAQDVVDEALVQGSDHVDLKAHPESIGFVEQVSIALRWT